MHHNLEGKNSTLFWMHRDETKRCVICIVYFPHLTTWLILETFKLYKLPSCVKTYNLNIFIVKHRNKKSGQLAGIFMNPAGNGFSENQRSGAGISGVPELRCIPS